MAKVIGLMSRIPEIIEDIYENFRKADERREIEFNAAVKIQSWYRGVRIRSYFRCLNENSMRIQKLWRGYLARKNFRTVLLEQVKRMRLQFYNRKATIIQKHWRGFYSRKYIYNYYRRKAYLIAVQQKNEAVLAELKEYKENMKRQQEEEKNIEKYRKLEEEAKRTHYLISTKQINGVYNSPFKATPSEMEYLMRNIKLEPAQKHDFYVKTLKANKFEHISLPENLPPLPPKPQGPFREPLEVRKQRYRPLSPSLRVESDFESLKLAREKVKQKEWVERLHDEIFIPLDKSVNKRPYQPMILTTSKYGALDYGTKNFRDECDPKDFVGNRFKTVIPPIPDFNKLNRTYVDAHYYLS